MEVLTSDPFSVDECGIFRMPCTSNVREQLDCLGGNGNGSKVHHPHFESSALRLRSFALWPAALEPRPQALADAGFFYTGEGDRCVCFSCGGGLKDWEVTDDPLIEHKTHFPKCPYVIKELAKARLLANRSSSIPQPTSATNTAIADALLCKVCYHNQMCMTLLPCKHVSSCESCAQGLTQCPICRESIKSSFKIYLQ